MKCGLSMYSLVAPVRAGQLDLYGFLDYAARVGAEGVELLEMFWTDENSEIVEVKRRCAALGMMLPVYSISTNFFQPDAAARAQQLKSLCHGVDVAAQLGAGLLRVFSGDQIPGYSLEQGINWVVDSLCAGADYASSQGITLALENHGRVAGRSEQVRGIIEAVSSPALRANLDTGNFLLVGQNPLQAASALVDLVALVHLKDFTYAAPDETGHVYQGLDGKSYTGSIVGEGLVDLAGIHSVLAGNGYDGWLSLEYEGNAEPLEHAVPRCLAAMHALLQ